MDLAAEANRLLRNQLRDVAGQLLNLAERVGILTQELEGVDHAQHGTGGVNPRGIPPTGVATFQGAVNLAVRAELERTRRAHPYPGPTGDSYPSGRATKRQRKGPKPGQATREGPEPPTPCVICDGAHSRMNCPWRDGHCFRCGRPGHTRYECPRKPAVTRPPAPRPDDLRQTDSSDTESPPRYAERGWPKGGKRISSDAPGSSDAESQNRE